MWYHTGGDVHEFCPNASLQLKIPESQIYPVGHSESPPHYHTKQIFREVSNKYQSIPHPNIHNIVSNRRDHTHPTCETSSFSQITCNARVYTNARIFHAIVERLEQIPDENDKSWFLSIRFIWHNYIFRTGDIT